MHTDDSMELLSFRFLLLAVGSTVWLLSARGSLRSAGFALACLWYVESHTGPAGLLATLAFCALGYGSAVTAARVPRATAGCVLFLTAAFVWMRGYMFVPEDWRASFISTAGLSFLFFKILHVVVDSGSGTLERLGIVTYFNYCLNFTTFLLGPIQRYGDFDRQWRGEEASIEPGFEAHLDAVNRILRGLVKKYVVAELLGGYVLQPGDDIAAMSASEVLLGSYGFYFLLYFDFSGYCDVVIGVGQLMGVRPPENFDLPFLSPNVADFWLRVHRSLTLWLTDYVFNPVYARLLRAPTTRERPGLSMSVALLVTMIVSGLWHGTTLGFALFGLTHGIYLVVYRAFERALIARVGRAELARLRGRSWWKALSVLLTFNVTALAFPFFLLDAEALAGLARLFVGS